jgi:hypothetical protein
MGIFKYDFDNLAYGLDHTKFVMEELSSQELNELTNYYWRKGYTLNYSGNIISENPELIMISWKKPQKQTIEDKLYLFKFKLNRLRRLFNISIVKRTKWSSQYDSSTFCFRLVHNYFK